MPVQAREPLIKLEMVLNIEKQMDRVQYSVTQAQRKKDVGCFTKYITYPTLSSAAGGMDRVV